jgi:hypothetical protein
MKRLTTISLLKQDLADDVKLNRIRKDVYIEFVNSSSNRRESQFGIKVFDYMNRDVMVGCIFDLSLTHYIDKYIAYGGGDGKKTSYSIFLNECGRNRKNTNIDSEVVELMREVLSNG